MSDGNSTTAVEYREIPGFDGAYQVGSDGSVWSRHVPRKHTLGPWRRLTAYIYNQKDGYLRVNLTTQGKRIPKKVHRLVLETFVRICPIGLECRHLDGDPANNRLENLQWATHAENLRDRVQHGTDTRGEQHPMAKLSISDVQVIRQQLAQKVPHRAIAQQFAVHCSTISLIARGHNWAWLKPEQG